MTFQAKWENAVITDVSIALYVTPSNKRTVHTNRRYHGFVINEQGANRDYHFSDGRVMCTGGGDLFYLPKGSTYVVKKAGGDKSKSCYAINFDGDFSDEPFVIGFRNPETPLKLFMEADMLWKRQAPFSALSVRKILYEIILCIQREFEKKYTSQKTNRLLAPAIEKINESFNDNSLSISELAATSGVSEAYLRRLFLNKYGVSPKDYIINLRMNYAKNLLSSGELSVFDIALMCGYSEPTHFSREFSKRVGISPNEYKKIQN